MTATRLLEPLLRIRRSLQAAFAKPLRADLMNIPESRSATSEKDASGFNAMASADLSYPIPLLAR